MIEKKKIRDFQVEDVKRYCNRKSNSIERGFCSGCVFRIKNDICLMHLFLINGSGREDITCKSEMAYLRMFKETQKDSVLDMEIEI